MGPEPLAEFISFLFRDRCWQKSYTLTESMGFILADLLQILGSEKVIFIKSREFFGVGPHPDAFLIKLLTSFL